MMMIKKRFAWWVYGASSVDMEDSTLRVLAKDAGERLAAKEGHLLMVVRDIEYTRLPTGISDTDAAPRVDGTGLCVMVDQS